jgi:integrase
VVRSAGKSSTAVRTIDLDENLVAVLRMQLRMQEVRREESADHYVFAKRSGEPFHPQYLSKLLAKQAVAAGLPRLTAHGLRHTSATLMLDSGVPAKVAAERLGHSDPTLFTNLYSHVTPTMQEAAAKAIGSALFGDAA